MSSDRHEPETSESEKYPARRLSQIGGWTTGWRSDLESGSGQSIGSFILSVIVAIVLVAGLIFLIVQVLAP